MQIFKRSVFKVTADYVNISGFTVKGAISNAIYLVIVAHCNITNVSNNDYGIWLRKSSNNTLTSNNASNNDYGIRLRYSSNNIIANNTISNNDWDGIALYNSANNTIANNTFVNDGLFVRDSYDKLRTTLSTENRSSTSKMPTML